MSEYWSWPCKRRRVEEHAAIHPCPNSKSAQCQGPESDVPNEGRVNQRRKTLASKLSLCEHSGALGQSLSSPERDAEKSRSETEILCFGMVRVSHRSNHQSSKSNESQIKDIVLDTPTPHNLENRGIIQVTLNEPNVLVRAGSQEVFANLAQRTATMLRNLEVYCTLQLFCLTNTQHEAHDSSHHKQSGKKGIITPTILCVNVYGPSDIGESVGEFFTKLKMHLQDPVHCDRDVVYLNPHLLCNDRERVTTLSLTKACSAPDIEHVADKPDLYELLRNEETLPETETPATLITGLYRQDQPLTFKDKTLLF